MTLGVRQSHRARLDTASCAAGWGLLCATALLPHAAEAAGGKYKVGHSSPFLMDPGQVVQVNFASKAAKKDEVTVLPPTSKIAAFWVDAVYGAIVLLSLIIARLSGLKARS